MAVGVLAALEPCEPPRPPEAVVAFGAAARALALRLLEQSDRELAALACGASAELLIVRGAAIELPWVDGAVYLASLPGAPELLVPAHHAPNVPPELLARALQHKHARPSAWLRDPSGRDVLLPLATLRPPSRARLQRFAEGGAP